MHGYELITGSYLCVTIGRDQGAQTLISHPINNLFNPINNLFNPISNRINNPADCIYPFSTLPAKLSIGLSTACEQPYALPTFFFTPWSIIACTSQVRTHAQTTGKAMLDFRKKHRNGPTQYRLYVLNHNCILLASSTMEAMNLYRAKHSQAVYYIESISKEQATAKLLEWEEQARRTALRH